jgi:hypothetical protein
MYTHKEQVAHGEKLVAAATRWAEAKGFGFEKVLYAKTFAAATAAVQDDSPSMLSFDEMRELTEVLSKVE